MPKILQSLTRTMLLTFVFLCVLTVLLITYLETTLPDVEVLRDIQLQVPLKIYSSDHKLIAEYGDKRRTPIELKNIPKNLINAIIATEDRRFYQHPGVDLRGLARAAITLISKGNKEQGGSTITMQVARNFFLTRNKTFIRKFNEILLALKIEQELSKEEILELYLNKIYLGKRAYGVQAAAEVYYGTTVDKLTLAQMAMIAGLPQAPSSINPINSPKAAFKRREHVLKRMLTYSFINAAEYQEAISQPITAKYHGKTTELYAPYIAEMVRQDLVNKYGEEVYNSGYEVVTSIDSKLQEYAKNSLEKSLLEYDKRHGFRGAKQQLQFNHSSSAEDQLDSWLNELKNIPNIANLTPAVITAIEPNKALARIKTGQYIEILWKNMSWAANKNDDSPDDIIKIGDIIYVENTNNNTWYLSQVPEVEGAIVAMDPHSGAIKALVGGFDFEQSRFNRATQAERQPGSSFKPFIYGAALDNGFTNASIINDAPIIQENLSAEFDWRPQNHTKQFYGPTRLRVGIAESRNLVSIRLLQSLGINKAIKFMTDCGLNENSLPKGLSLALGTNPITPLDLTASYSVFPNGGYKIKPFLIKEIKNFQDEIIFKINENNNPERAISEQTAYLMTSLLKDSAKKTNKQLGRKDLSGKTGSTNDWKDAWFAGFNRDLMVTAWVGFDEPRSLKEYGVKAALPMWKYFMSSALKDKPENTMPEPDGIVTVKIDPKTGLLARPGQSNAIYEIFKEGTIPEKSSNDTEIEQNDDTLINKDDNSNNSEEINSDNKKNIKPDSDDIIEGLF